MNMLELFNPYDGSLIERVPVVTRDRLETVLAAAKRNLRAWRADYERRALVVKTFQSSIARDREQLAATLCQETGKPVSQARAEIDAFLGRIDFFLAHTPDCLGSRQVHSGRENVGEEISFDPLGIVGCISAWNYPYFVGGNVFVPALLTGNAVLYKPSEIATLTGLAIERHWRAAGVPDGIFTTMVGAADAGELLVSAPIDGLFFTGSFATGRAIARAVAGRMIPLQMELGGKDAVYVCDDADLDRTVPGVADGAFYNTGQGCCSVERIYVHRSIYDTFLEKLRSTVTAFVVGDPRQERTYIGPLARAAQVEVLERQVADALSRGGKLVSGGERMAGSGNFFAPTIVVDAPHDASIVQEESFGPIVYVRSVADDAEAVELMDDTRYGLTAGVYTPSQARARAVLEQLDVGSCYWNACDRVSPALPWSGRRDSGVGVTLSTLGIRQFIKPRAWHWVR